MDLATEWKLGAGREQVGTQPELAELDFPGFVAARSGALFRGALVLTGNRDAAEDLVQETLERACRKWRTIAAKDAPDAYVRRIMVNLANDRWRRFRRMVPLVSPVPHQDTGDRAAPGDEYGRIDSRDQLVRALQKLPMRTRTVVVLRYFHDLSDAEIAADMQISESTVRSQLARGIGKLRSQFPARSDPSPQPPQQPPQPTEGTR
ncbi:SigE family RNA polymerase sigma factor [Streptomyces sp. NBC_00075]|uniref:SigE family RNA polymerase sigma factor n=1 Tax=Streptomyces sp. NBC_00093 TaxID=2975649 RepID=A0AAU1ZZI6_9ACTN